jgi:hypothetical protein
MAHTIRIAQPVPALGAGLPRRLAGRALALLRAAREVIVEARAMQAEAERRYGFVRE